MFYTKCHNVDIFHLKKLIMLIILAIGGGDILRPWGIYITSFPNYVRDPKYHNR